jgi:hypothetical protein
VAAFDIGRAEREVWDVRVRAPRRARVVPIDLADGPLDDAACLFAGGQDVPVLV